MIQAFRDDEQNYFQMVLAQKLIRSLTSIAEQNCQIKRRSDGNIVLKRTKEHYFCSGHINQLYGDQNPLGQLYGDQNPLGGLFTSI